MQFFFISRFHFFHYSIPFKHNKVKKRRVLSFSIPSENKSWSDGERTISQCPINKSPIRSHCKHRYRNIYRIHLNVSWYVANERHNRCKQKNNNAFITRSVSFFPSSIIPRCWLYWIITFFDVIQVCMCFFLCSHVATRVLYLSEKKKKRHI